MGVLDTLGVINDNKGGVIQYCSLLFIQKIGDPLCFNN